MQVQGVPFESKLCFCNLKKKDTQQTLIYVSTGLEIVISYPNLPGIPFSDCTIAICKAPVYSNGERYRVGLTVLFTFPTKYQTN